MNLIDGRKSTVVTLTVGTGGVTKGDLVVWSRIQLSKRRREIRPDDIVGIALATALRTTAYSKGVELVA